MSTNKITYYFDALCGWCFGFTDVMEQIFQKYGNDIEFEVVSGGLFMGERVGKINDVAPYIKAGAFRSVEQTTGVKFGKDFLENALENNSMEMNSIYPAIALAIVKEVAPKKKMEYASTLLKALCFGFAKSILCRWNEC